MTAVRTSNATKNPPTDRQKRARKNLNCSLGNFGKECGQPSVTTVHETRLCQKHFRPILEKRYAKVYVTYPCPYCQGFHLASCAELAA